MKALLLSSVLLCPSAPAPPFRWEGKWHWNAWTILLKHGGEYEARGDGEIGREYITHVGRWRPLPDGRVEVLERPVFHRSGGVWPSTRSYLRALPGRRLAP